MNATNSQRHRGLLAELYAVHPRYRMVPCCTSGVQLTRPFAQPDDKLSLVCANAADRAELDAPAEDDNFGVRNTSLTLAQGVDDGT